MVWMRNILIQRLAAQRAAAVEAPKNILAAKREEALAMTAPAIAALPSPGVEIPEYVQKGLFDPVGFKPGDWTKEEVATWPYTPEGFVDPRSGFFQFLSAPGGKITEVLETKTIHEILEMHYPPPGIALPGIGEIKFPDVGGMFAEMKNTLIIAGAVLFGAYLLTRGK